MIMKLWLDYKHQGCCFVSEIKEIDLSAIFETIYPKIRERARSSEIFKRLTKRKYRPVNGYIDWQEIMLEFAVCLNGISTLINQGSANPLLLLSAELINDYFHHKSPSYWLDADLCQTLQECDIPEGVKELPKSISRGLILLPLEYTPVNKDRQPVQWILFSRFSAGQELLPISASNRYVKSEPIEKDCILWTSQCPDSGLYSGAITADFRYHSVTPTGITPCDDEKRIAEEVSSLLLQCLLIAEYYPEYTEPAPESGIGFSRKLTQTKNQNVWLNPRKVGDLYKKKVRSRSESLGETHASPSEHYRRGHWKNQAYGEKWSQHRMILVPPCTVSTGN